jgi:hypothetical protein
VAAVLQGCNDEPVWGWQPLAQAYNQADVLRPLDAYWVHYAGSDREPVKVLSVVGTAVGTTSRQLDHGWHLVGPVGGPPYGPVPMAGAVEPQDAVLPPPWGWSQGRYVSVDLLTCGQGYWVYVERPCILRLAGNR